MVIFFYVKKKRYAFTAFSSFRSTSHTLFVFFLVNTVSHSCYEWSCLNALNLCRLRAVLLFLPWLLLPFIALGDRSFFQSNS